MNRSVTAARCLVAVLGILFAQSSTYAADKNFDVPADSISIASNTGGHEYYLQIYRVDMTGGMFNTTPTRVVNYVQSSAVDFPMMPGYKKYTYSHIGGIYTTSAYWATGIVFLRSTTGGADTFVKDVNFTILP